MAGTVKATPLCSLQTITEGDNTGEVKMPTDENERMKRICGKIIAK